jgi:hypothetical protein
MMMAFRHNLGFHDFTTHRYIATKNCYAYTTNIRHFDPSKVKWEMMKSDSHIICET